MDFSITSGSSSRYQVFLISGKDQLKQLETLQPEELKYVRECLGRNEELLTVNQYRRMLYIVCLQTGKTSWETAEKCRKAGAVLHSVLETAKASEVLISDLSGLPDAALLYAEGLALAGYRFLKYRSDRERKTPSLNRILFRKGAVEAPDAARLAAIIGGVFRARDLVNEPLNSLGARELSEAFRQMGKEAGFKVTVLDADRIRKEKMGGLLAVNKGSVQPPTFTIMEYKPRNAVNSQPLVLVGKGIVYDTGGLSLKPTPASMDRMKSDMSGAAVVAGTMYALSRLELPLHVIALVPATDNRPGGDAYTPGDIITMYSGATVEVLNTDAEGRLVLADALHWAKRYEPGLVIDLATLTGAAAVALGAHGIACMGTADDSVKKALSESGFRQYERLVEYPLWEEYGKMIRSDIADLKNIGGPSGGAITAGKFLEYFTDYPWMHFDIAGVSFATESRGYIPAGGTAVGLRMLLDFLSGYREAS